MNLARVIHEEMRLIDEAVKLINEQIQSSKDERTRQAYEDYKRHLREIGSSIYSLVGKMRIDRVLDPPELSGLDEIASTGLILAEAQKQNER